MQPESVRFARTNPGTPHPRLLRPALRALREALDRSDGPGIERAGRLMAESVATAPHRAAAVRLAQVALEALVLSRSEPLSPPTLECIDDAGAALDGAGDVPAVVDVLLRLWRDVTAGLAPPALPAASLPDRIAQHLAAHLTFDTRLGDLARQLGYSPSHVSALVQQATGRRFTALRTDLQLDRACALLRGGASIKAAALGAGFRDPDYLGRVFRRRFGMSPNAWRVTEGLAPASARLRTRAR